MATDCETDPLLTRLARAVLFKTEDKGKTYRIPALLYVSEAQTFLAFAEERRTPRDCDAEVLVMRRGSFMNGSIEWSPSQTLSSACLPDHRTMNPCPVFERNSQTIFLFFTCVLGNTTERWQILTGKNKARLCYVTSSDYGLSWSRASDLTLAVAGDEMQSWATFAVGPGHGVQMRTGRLIIPAYVYYIRCRLCGWPLCVRPHALAFYSDDAGVTWTRGEKMSMESLECEMAEVEVGVLYCNARSRRGRRVEAVSQSGGGTFLKPHYAWKLLETSDGCEGSVLSFSVSASLREKEGEDSKTWLLYSHPTDRRNRRNLGVYLNKRPLSPSAWGRPLIIYKGPAGYSDLAQSEEGFYCLMECGVKSEIEEIAFVEFKLNDLLNC